MIKKAINSLVRPIVFRRMISIASERPIEVNIETTSLCHSRCVFCPNSKLPKNAETMDNALFGRICKEYYEMGGGTLWISSMQSDLFSDRLMMSRLEVLKKYKIKFVLIASTTLIGASRLSDAEMEIFLSTFDRVDVSIGGLCREDYRIMHGGVDAFENVLDQLSRIEEIIKKKNFDIEIRLFFRTNDKEKILSNELFHKLKKTWSVGEIRSDFFSWGGVISQSDLPPGANLKSADNSSKRGNCVVPWASLCVNVDGTVAGCGCIDWMGRHPIGNMRTQTLCDIWNGAEAREFRTAFSRQSIPDICLHCSSYLNVEDAFGRIGLINYTPRDGCYWSHGFYDVLRRTLTIN